jgi:NAD-dependent dihydropyrimidine dehydrogenase PreA subunit
MRYIPIILVSLLLGAHHYRAGEWGLIGLWLSLPFALLIRRRWADRAVQVVLLAGAVEWLLTLQTIVGIYRRMGLPTARSTIIMVSVALVTAAAGLMLETAGRRRRLPDHDPVAPGLAAFLVAGGLLAVVQVVVARPMILAERFLPAAGWWEAGLLAFYAGWLSDRLREPRAIKQLRPKVWLAFSILFFTQLLVGMAGVDRLLMSGKLHLPVPALIAAGPLYRGGGLFMAILFSVSVLVAGPAWCSWLCYIGAWDDRFARARKRPGRLPAWRRHFRWILLIAVFGAAFALGRLGVGTVTAGWLAAGFGLVGVGVMATWSRRTGHMTHCTAWCPMGFVATRLGKVSPWRLRISDGCTDCGACTPACRYDALYPQDVLRRMPSEACTLCGDCLSRCPTGSIEYRWLRTDPEKARRAFFIIVAALHAVWLGVARL